MPVDDGFCVHIEGHMVRTSIAGRDDRLRRLQVEKDELLALVDRLVGKCADGRLINHAASVVERMRNAKNDHQRAVRELP